jgi:ABC-type Na+ efflux pump permease subunit
LNTKTIGLGIGALLIIIALILGGLQLFWDSNGYGYDFTPTLGRRLVVYGVFGVIGLIGIIIAAWALMKKETPKTTTATPTATTTATTTK